MGRGERLTAGAERGHVAPDRLRGLPYGRQDLAPRVLTIGQHYAASAWLRRRRRTMLKPKAFEFTRRLGARGRQVMFLDGGVPLP